MKFIELEGGFYACDDGNLYKDGKVVKCNVSPKGYYQFYIKGCKDVLVHRIIASCFIPNEEGKPCVDHINGDKLDNRVENLKWVTYKENANNPITKAKNAEHAFKVGHKLYDSLSSETKERMKEASRETARKINEKRRAYLEEHPEIVEEIKNRRHEKDREYRKSHYVPHPRVLLTEEEKKERYLKKYPNGKKYLTEEELAERRKMKEAERKAKAKERYYSRIDEMREYRKKYRQEHLEELREKDRERYRKRYAKDHPGYIPYFHREE